MAQVTICVPAYDAAAFIGQTLASLRAQTYTDFEVLVALEPKGADETVSAMRSFLRDPRFGYYVNGTNHGYAPNVREVMTRVRTPYYSILPHDDLWHPRYLELLMAHLTARPDASAACGDMYIFEALAGGISFPLADGPLFERLLTFFLDGAMGMPWHGVARSDTLDKPFPDNEFDGFAVEGEWSLHLLLRGVVVREPEAIYLKRLQPETSETAVSVGWRTRQSETNIARSLEHHRVAMLALLATADVPAADRRILELAAETAMLGRWVAFSTKTMVFSAREEERAAATLGALEADGSTHAQAILSRMHAVLSRYNLRHSKLELGLQHAQAAVASAPENGDAQALLAGAYLALGRVTDALAPLRRVGELLPLSLQLRNLQNQVAKQLGTVWLRNGAV